MIGITSKTDVLVHFDVDGVNYLNEQIKIDSSKFKIVPNGRFGHNCAYFDGGAANGISLLNYNPNLLIEEGEFTIEMVCKVFRKASGSHVLVDYSANAIASRNYGDIFYIDDESGKIGFKHINKGVHGSFRGVDYTDKYGKFTAIAFTISKSNNKVCIFLDGNKVFEDKLNDLCSTSASGSFSIFTNVGDNASNKFVGYVNELRIAREISFTDDYIPYNRPYSYVGVTDINLNTINFSVSNAINIDKIDIFVNDVFSQTYTENFDNVTYDIDECKLGVGVNLIDIRVTYDTDKVIDEIINYDYSISPLQTEASFLDILDRINIMVNSKKLERELLANILKNKNIEVNEEDCMLSLIDKVKLFDNYDYGELWLYKDGVENITFDTSWYKGNYPTCTKNSDNLNIINRATGYAVSTGGYVSSSIDISEYKLLNVETTIKNATNGNVMIAVGTSDSVFDVSLSTVKGITFSDKVVISLDISKVSGNKYIYIGVEGPMSSVVEASFYKIWLEK